MGYGPSSSVSTASSNTHLPCDILIQVMPNQGKYVHCLKYLTFVYSENIQNPFFQFPKEKHYHYLQLPYYCAVESQNLLLLSNYKLVPINQFSHPSHSPPLPASENHHYTFNFHEISFQIPHVRPGSTYLSVLRFFSLSIMTSSSLPTVGNAKVSPFYHCEVFS